MRSPLEYDVVFFFSYEEREARLGTEGNTGSSSNVWSWRVGNETLCIFRGGTGGRWKVVVAAVVAFLGSAASESLSLR